MKNLLSMISVALVLAACNHKDVKENINKTGDVAGQAIGELAQGMQAGVEKAFEVNVTVSGALAAKGIATGEITYGKDRSENDNKLTVYVIFNKPYKGAITAKVYNTKQLEMGRSKVTVNGAQEDARFVEFKFDKRTDIDNDCKIVLE